MGFLRESIATAAKYRLISLGSCVKGWKAHTEWGGLAYTV